MKRILVPVTTLLLALALVAGCGGGGKSDTLKIGASPVPHKEILEFIKPLAEEQGLKLEIIRFTDYVQPNEALANKELDANFFQHAPYLKQFAQERNMDLVSAGAVHLEPLGIYSTKAETVADIKDGSVITIPNDSTNGGRALHLMAKEGLIKLKDGAGLEATVSDVVENPKNLNIKMMNAEMLATTLEDAGASVINTNYVLEAIKSGTVNPKTLAKESAQDNPYLNVIAVRKGDETRPEIKKLMELLSSDEVKQFMEEKYDGAVLPAS